MVIDPLAPIILWLRSSSLAGLVENRIAAKHEYGGAWGEGKTGLSVHLDAGAEDLYAEVATPRLELRIYADDQEKVVKVWMELKKLSRENERFEVVTATGRALVHYFKPETSLSLLYDEVIRMELGVVFFEAMISENPVV